MAPVRIFISHAFEDKADFVSELAQALDAQKDFEVWYDEYELKLGDRLLDSISKGLRESDYGALLSFAKAIQDRISEERE
jgi:TIR domain